MERFFCLILCHSINLVDILTGTALPWYTEWCVEKDARNWGCLPLSTFPPPTVTPRVQGLGSAAGPVHALYQSLCRSYAASRPTGSKPKIVYKQYWSLLWKICRINHVSICLRSFERFLGFTALIGRPGCFCPGLQHYRQDLVRNLTTKSQQNSKSTRRM